ncbi:MAG: dipeptide ABC transporter ATP-binding protein [Gammaproteobacteria bacterium]|nr:dipeptide ABC transporter ATP-binding protein [Gammaproteobacteria bacterium]MDX5375145.1 dipeptide ABC transporter ATP-binding protein [Gammaproteobacteria bacterium]
MLLEVKGLRTWLKRADGLVRAVDDVSFSIAPGETYCLVGESGSGKSVTALSIIQLLPQDIASHPGGEIWFDYRHDDGRRERIDLLRSGTGVRRIRGGRIGMIFQEPMTSLNPVFTVGEQLIEALRVHYPGIGAAEARARAIDALAQVQIPDPASRIDDYPHQLSGGQRQRVMIAMAMACEPDLLIADEPTTALDVTVQREILRLMRDLQARRGTSILFITHDFGVVSEMADRVGVMRHGKLVEEGAVDELLRHPAHPYTRQLLAALPENLERRPRTAVLPLGTPQVPGPLLSIQDLKVHFPVRKGLFRRVVDHVPAVDGVSLDVHPGQIVALVGESGCGKTTLGRAVLRLEEPTGGSVRFDGQAVTGLSRKALRPYRRAMQIIFQDPMSSLNPRLNIATTLTEPMKVHGIGADQDERIARAETVLRRVQLEPDSLWRYPHEFSGGQRQRIGIARALVLEPRFIVCDEVTSALDVSVQAEILEILLGLRAEQGLSMLFITHDIGVVEFLSDITAVMKDGLIVEMGETAQVCGRPAHAYTQKLLAAVPRLRDRLAG